MTARIRYMDIAKGIGIICVLVGHTFSWENVGVLVNTFHMPLFFIISGFFFSPKQHMKLMDNKRLLLPYGVTILSFFFFFLLHGKYEEALTWCWGGGIRQWI